MSRPWTYAQTPSALCGATPHSRTQQVRPARSLCMRQCRPQYPWPNNTATRHKDCQLLKCWRLHLHVTSAWLRTCPHDCPAVSASRHVWLYSHRAEQHFGRSRRQREHHAPYVVAAAADLCSCKQTQTLPQTQHAACSPDVGLSTPLDSKEPSELPSHLRAAWTHTYTHKG